MPYGVPVPPDQPLTALPEPYNPQKHGASLPDQTPQANRIGTPGYVPGPSPRRLPGPPSSSAPAPGDVDRPIYLYTNTVRWHGVAATHDVRADMALPPASTLTNAGAVFIYAPTLLPPGGSCVEATTIHQRTQNDAATVHLQGWYDWCGYNRPGGVAGWYYQQPMDALFFNNYVRTYNGQPAISISIVTPTNYNGCWYGHLYNYSVGGWEQKISSCGTTQIGHNTGWTAWESWNLQYGCPVLANARATQINFADPRPGQPDWVAITDHPNDMAVSVGYGPCWSQNTYTFQMPAPGEAANSWLAHTPNP